MTKNKVMYDFALLEYRNAINRKNDIRTRAAKFYSLAFTIISAVTTISFSVSNDEFSKAKIIVMILAAIVLIIATAIFLIIYSPSSQETHLPKNVLSDLRNIEDANENKDLINYYKNNNDYKFIVSEISMAYVAERAVENFHLYDEKNKFFMKLFSWMSFSIISCIILVMVSIVLWK